jgi:hypothetical protein
VCVCVCVCVCVRERTIGERETEIAHLLVETKGPRAPTNSDPACVCLVRTEMIGQELVFFSKQRLVWRLGQHR